MKTDLQGSHSTAQARTENCFKGVRQASKKPVESLGGQKCRRIRKAVQGNGQSITKDINTKQWQL